MSGHVLSDEVLRRQFDDARAARDIASRRVARLARRLGHGDLTADELREVYVQAHGDTPEKQARRRTLLAQDVAAMHATKPHGRTNRLRRGAHA